MNLTKIYKDYSAFNPLGGASRGKTKDVFRFSISKEESFI